MRGVKQLFLSTFLFYAALTKVQGFKVIIGQFIGTLSEDSLTLPPQTQGLEIGWADSNQTAGIGTGAICTASALRTVELSFGWTKPPILQQNMFENCENLTELVIRGDSDHATELKAGLFQNFLKLKTFEANYFKIHRLTRGFFAGMNSLSSLSLYECAIEEITPGAFDDLKMMEMLSLQHNNITVLPMRLFRDLSQLKSLNLAENQIAHLNWDGFDGLLFSLELLHLQLNQLTFLDADEIAKYMPNLKYINIAYNAMNCTTMTEFVQQLRKKLCQIADVFTSDFSSDGANCEFNRLTNEQID